MAEMASAEADVAMETNTSDWVEIIVDKKPFQVSRQLLSRHSPFFKKIFKKDKHRYRRKLKLSGVPAETFQVLVDFMRTGELSILPVNVADVFNAAFRLHMSALVKKCIQSETEASPVGQHILMFATARRLRMHDEEKRSFAFLAAHFTAVALGREFLEMDVEDVAALMESNRLCCHCEMEVFEACMRWLDYAPKSRCLYTERLMGLVRFNNMNLSELHLCLENSVVMTNVTAKQIIMDAILAWVKAESAKSPLDRRDRIYKSVINVSESCTASPGTHSYVSKMLQKIAPTCGFDNRRNNRNVRFDIGSSSSAFNVSNASLTKKAKHIAFAEMSVHELNKTYTVYSNNDTEKDLGDTDMDAALPGRDNTSADPPSWTIMYSETLMDRKLSENSLRSIGELLTTKTGVFDQHCEKTLSVHPSVGELIRLEAKSCTSIDKLISFAEEVNDYSVQSKKENMLRLNVDDYDNSSTRDGPVEKSESRADFLQVSETSDSDNRNASTDPENVVKKCPAKEYPVSLKNSKLLDPSPCHDVDLISLIECFHTEIKMSILNRLTTTNSANEKPKSVTNIEQNVSSDEVLQEKLDSSENQRNAKSIMRAAQRDPLQTISPTETNAALSTFSNTVLNFVSPKSVFSSHSQLIFDGRETPLADELLLSIVDDVGYTENLEDNNDEQVRGLRTEVLSGEMRNGLLNLAARDSRMMGDSESSANARERESLTGGNEGQANDNVPNDDVGNASKFKKVSHQLFKQLDFSMPSINLDLESNFSSELRPILSDNTIPVSITPNTNTNQIVGIALTNISQTGESHAGNADLIDLGTRPVLNQNILGSFQATSGSGGIGTLSTGTLLGTTRVIRRTLTSESKVKNSTGKKHEIRFKRDNNGNEERSCHVESTVQEEADTRKEEDLLDTLIPLKHDSMDSLPSLKADIQMEKISTLPKLDQKPSSTFTTESSKSKDQPSLTNIASSDLARDIYSSIPKKQEEPTGIKDRPLFTNNASSNLARQTDSLSSKQVKEPTAATKGLKENPSFTNIAPSDLAREIYSSKKEPQEVKSTTIPKDNTKSDPSKSTNKISSLPSKTGNEQKVTKPPVQVNDNFDQPETELQRVTREILEKRKKAGDGSPRKADGHEKKKLAFAPGKDKVNIAPSQPGDEEDIDVPPPLPNRLTKGGRRDSIAVTKMHMIAKELGNEAEDEDEEEDNEEGPHKEKHKHRQSPDDDKDKGAGGSGAVVGGHNHDIKFVTGDSTSSGKSNEKGSTSKENYKKPPSDNASKMSECKGMPLITSQPIISDRDITKKIKAAESLVAASMTTDIVSTERMTALSKPSARQHTFDINKTHVIPVAQMESSRIVQNTTTDNRTNIEETIIVAKPSKSSIATSIVPINLSLLPQLSFVSDNAVAHALQKSNFTNDKSSNIMKDQKPSLTKQTVRVVSAQPHNYTSLQPLKPSFIVNDNETDTTIDNTPDSDAATPAAKPQKPSNATSILPINISALPQLNFVSDNAAVHALQKSNFTKDKSSNIIQDKKPSLTKLTVPLVPAQSQNFTSVQPIEPSFIVDDTTTDVTADKTPNTNATATVAKQKKSSVTTSILPISPTALPQLSFVTDETAAHILQNSEEKSSTIIKDKKPSLTKLTIPIVPVQPQNFTVATMEPSLIAHDTTTTEKTPNTNTTSFVAQPKTSSVATSILPIKASVLPQLTFVSDKEPAHASQKSAFNKDKSSNIIKDNTPSLTKPIVPVPAQSQNFTSVEPMKPNFITQDTTTDATIIDDTPDINATTAVVKLKKSSVATSILPIKSSELPQLSFSFDNGTKYALQKSGINKNESNNKTSLTKLKLPVASEQPHNSTSVAPMEEKPIGYDTTTDSNTEKTPNTNAARTVAEQTNSSVAESIVLIKPLAIPQLSFVFDKEVPHVSQKGGVNEDKSRDIMKHKKSSLTKLVVPFVSEQQHNLFSVAPMETRLIAHDTRTDATTENTPNTNATATVTKKTKSSIATSILPINPSVLPQLSFVSDNTVAHASQKSAEKSSTILKDKTHNLTKPIVPVVPAKPQKLISVASVEPRVIGNDTRIDVTTDNTSNANATTAGAKPKKSSVATSILPIKPSELLQLSFASASQKNSANKNISTDIIKDKKPSLTKLIIPFASAEENVPKRNSSKTKTTSLQNVTKKPSHDTNTFSIVPLRLLQPSVEYDNITTDTIQTSSDLKTTAAFGVDEVKQSFIMPVVPKLSSEVNSTNDINKNDLIAKDMLKKGISLERQTKPLDVKGNILPIVPFATSKLAPHDLTNVTLNMASSERPCVLASRNGQTIKQIADTSMIPFLSTAPAICSSDFRGIVAKTPNRDIVKTTTKRPSNNTLMLPLNKTNIAKQLTAENSLMPFIENLPTETSTAGKETSYAEFNDANQLTTIFHDFSKKAVILKPPPEPTNSGKHHVASNALEPIQEETLKTITDSESRKTDVLNELMEKFKKTNLSASDKGNKEYRLPPQAPLKPPKKLIEHKTSEAVPVKPLDIPHSLQPANESSLVQYKPLLPLSSNNFPHEFSKKAIAPGNAKTTDSSMLISLIPDVAEKQLQERDFTKIENDNDLIMAPDIDVTLSNKTDPLTNSTLTMSPLKSEKHFGNTLKHEPLQETSTESTLRSQSGLVEVYKRPSLYDDKLVEINETDKFSIAQTGSTATTLDSSKIPSLLFEQNKEHRNQTEQNAVTATNVKQKHLSETNLSKYPLPLIEKLVRSEENMAKKNTQMPLQNQIDFRLVPFKTEQSKVTISSPLEPVLSKTISQDGNFKERTSLSGIGVLVALSALPESEEHNIFKKSSQPLMPMPMVVWNENIINPRKNSTLSNKGELVEHISIRNPVVYTSVSDSKIANQHLISSDLQETLVRHMNVANSRTKEEERQTTHIAVKAADSANSNRELAVFNDPSRISPRKSQTVALRKSIDQGNNVPINQDKLKASNIVEESPTMVLQEFPVPIAVSTEISKYPKKNSEIFENSKPVVPYHNNASLAMINITTKRTSSEPVQTTQVLPNNMSTSNESIKKQNSVKSIEYQKTDTGASPAKILFMQSSEKIKYISKPHNSSDEVPPLNKNNPEIIKVSDTHSDSVSEPVENKLRALSLADDTEKREPIPAGNKHGLANHKLSVLNQGGKGPLTIKVTSIAKLTSGKHIPRLDFNWEHARTPNAFLHKVPPTTDSRCGDLSVTANLSLSNVLKDKYSVASALLNSSSKGLSSQSDSPELTYSKKLGGARHQKDKSKVPEVQKSREPLITSLSLTDCSTLKMDSLKSLSVRSLASSSSEAWILSPKNQNLEICANSLSSNDKQTNILKTGKEALTNAHNDISPDTNISNESITKTTPGISGDASKDTHQTTGLLTTAHWSTQLNGATLAFDTNTTSDTDQSSEFIPLRSNPLSFTTNWSPLMIEKPLKLSKSSLHKSPSSETARSLYFRSVSPSIPTQCSAYVDEMHYSSSGSNPAVANLISTINPQRSNSNTEKKTTNTALVKVGGRPLNVSVITHARLLNPSGETTALPGKIIVSTSVEIVDPNVSDNDSAKLDHSNRSAQFSGTAEILSDDTLNVLASTGITNDRQDQPSIAVKFASSTRSIPDNQGDTSRTKQAASTDNIFSFSLNSLAPSSTQRELSNKMDTSRRVSASKQLVPMTSGLLMSSSTDEFHSLAGSDNGKLEPQSRRSSQKSRTLLPTSNDEDTTNMTRASNVTKPSWSQSVPNTLRTVQPDAELPSKLELAEYEILANKESDACISDLGQFIPVKGPQEDIFENEMFRTARAKSIFDNNERRGSAKSAMADNDDETQETNIPSGHNLGDLRGFVSVKSDTTSKTMTEPGSQDQFGVKHSMPLAKHSIGDLCSYATVMDVKQDENGGEITDTDENVERQLVEKLGVDQSATDTSDFRKIAFELKKRRGSVMPPGGLSSKGDTVSVPDLSESKIDVHEEQPTPDKERQLVPYSTNHHLQQMCPADNVDFKKVAQQLRLKRGSVAPPGGMSESPEMELIQSESLRAPRPSIAPAEFLSKSRKSSRVGLLQEGPISANASATSLLNMKTTKGKNRQAKTSASPTDQKLTESISGARADSNLNVVIFEAKLEIHGSMRVTFSIDAVAGNSENNHEPHISKLTIHGDALSGIGLVKSDNEVSRRKESERSADFRQLSAPALVSTSTKPQYDSRKKQADDKRIQVQVTKVPSTVSKPTPTHSRPSAQVVQNWLTALVPKLDELARSTESLTSTLAKKDDTSFGLSAPKSEKALTTKEPIAESINTAQKLISTLSQLLPVEFSQTESKHDRTQAIEDSTLPALEYQNESFPTQVKKMASTSSISSDLNKKPSKLSAAPQLSHGKLILPAIELKQKLSSNKKKQPSLSAAPAVQRSLNVPTSQPADNAELLEHEDAKLPEISFFRLDMQQTSNESITIDSHERLRAKQLEPVEQNASMEPKGNIDENLSNLRSMRLHESPHRVFPRLAAGQQPFPSLTPSSSTLENKPFDCLKNQRTTSKSKVSLSEATEILNEQEILPAIEQHVSESKVADHAQKKTEDVSLENRTLVALPEEPHTVTVEDVAENKHQDEDLVIQSQEVILKKPDLKSKTSRVKFNENDTPTDQVTTDEKTLTTKDNEQVAVKAAAGLPTDKQEISVNEAEEISITQKSKESPESKEAKTKKSSKKAERRKSKSMELVPVATPDAQASCTERGEVPSATRQQTEKKVPDNACMELVPIEEKELSGSLSAKSGKLSIKSVPDKQIASAVPGSLKKEATLATKDPEGKTATPPDSPKALLYRPTTKTAITQTDVTAPPSVSSEAMFASAPKETREAATHTRDIAAKSSPVPLDSGPRMSPEDYLPLYLHHVTINNKPSVREFIQNMAPRTEQWDDAVPAPWKINPAKDIEKHNSPNLQDIKHPIILLLGGINLSSISEVLTGCMILRYSPDEGNWKRCPMMPLPRYGHRVVRVGMEIYVIGGFDNRDATYGLRVSTSCCFKLNVQTGQWSMTKPMKHARGYHGVSVINDTIYVVGGVDANDMLLSSVEVYSPSKNEWTELSEGLYCGRMGMGVAAYKNSLWIVGGVVQIAGSQTCSTAYVEIYNPHTTMWSYATNFLPSPRTCVTLLDFDGRNLYCFGGIFYNTSNANRKLLTIGDVLVFCDKSKCWKEVTSLTTPRHNAQVVKYHDRAFLIGGQNVENPENPVKNMLEMRLNGENVEYKPLQDVPVSVTAYAAILIPPLDAQENSANSR